MLVDSGNYFEIGFGTIFMTEMYDFALDGGKDSNNDEYLIILLSVTAFYSTCNFLQPDKLKNIIINQLSPFKNTIPSRPPRPIIIHPHLPARLLPRLNKHIRPTKIHPRPPTIRSTYLSNRLLHIQSSMTLSRQMRADF